MSLTEIQEDLLPRFFGTHRFMLMTKGFHLVKHVVFDEYIFLRLSHMQCFNFLDLIARFHSQ